MSFTGIEPANGVKTLFLGEHTVLLRIDRHHDDQPVEEGQCPPHDIGMTNGERVEAACKERNAQGVLFHDALIVIDEIEASQTTLPIDFSRTLRRHSR